jgi:hypothetical protein
LGIIQLAIGNIHLNGFKGRSSAGADSTTLLAACALDCRGALCRLATFADRGDAGEYNARIRIRQLLWGLVIFAAILIISIVTTSLREAASR